ncbi:plasmid pRiA4b ORF-3 family protein [Streptomyces sp. OF3]|uniref:Plasmid pRiA4b ORF-3 family protein n=1 Tax=Streptomyces alkaliterrae TaxID=2213162 RepID=A0A7W3ZLL5_9ACTN|nr:plasmid pRiA4b ORF-3 family protein [Streptomyces alkaliterrae]
MANSRSAKPNSRTSPSRTVHKIKITLRDSRPPIWRRLEVPSGITLRELHDIIQAAFGWEDYHMWAFESGQDRYCVADRDLGIRSAAFKRLSQVAVHTGNRLRYTYDFGDDWEHDILVEDVTEPEPDTAYPRCLTGRRACPPEDCGGIWGYGYLIEILADPHHEEHEERLEWLGLDSADQFDPAAFDAANANSALSAFATVLVKS